MKLLPIIALLLLLTGCASKLDRAFMEKNGQNIDHADKLFQVYEMSESEKAAHATFFKTWREMNDEFKRGVK